MLPELATGGDEFAEDGIEHLLRRAVVAFGFGELPGLYGVDIPVGFIHDGHDGRERATKIEVVQGGVDLIGRPSPCRKQPTGCVVLTRRNGNAPVAVASDHRNGAVDEVS